MSIYIGIALLALGLLGILAAILLPLIRPLPRWPTREQMRLHRPYECRLCCVSYTRVWQLRQHEHFMHPEPDLEDPRVEERK